MNIHVWLIVLLAMSGFMGGVADDGIDQYQRAGELGREISSDDWTAIDRFLSDPEANTAAAAEVLKRHGAVLAALYRGSRQRDSGFAGFLPMHAATPPGAIEISQLERLVRADAMHNLLSGDTVAGGQAVASLHRMSQHVSESAIDTTSSMGMGLTFKANDLSRWATDRGLLDAAGASYVGAALRSYDTIDPFHTLSSLVETQFRMEEWITDLAEGQNLQSYAKYAEATFGVNVDLSVLEDAEARVEGLAQARVGVATIVTLVAEGAPQEEIEAAVAAFMQSDAAMFVPWAELQVKSLNSKMKYQREKALSEKATIEALAGGVDPTALQNAAVGYIEATKLLLADAEVRLALREGTLLDLVAAPLMQEALATITASAGYDTCNFAAALGVVPSLHRLEPIHDYAIVLGAIIECIVEEGEQQYARGATAEALTRWTLALRVAAHLGQDQSLFSSLTAADGLATLFETVLSHTPDPQAAEAKPFIAAIRSLSDTDPVGLAQAIRTLREVDLPRHLKSEGGKGPARGLPVDAAYVLGGFVAAELSGDSRRAEPNTKRMLDLIEPNASSSVMHSAVALMYNESTAAHARAGTFSAVTAPGLLRAIDNAQQRTLLQYWLVLDWIRGSDQGSGRPEPSPR
ncbi:MAG: hypothetical protein ACR2GY_00575 [Phycisphaerales bacterium]